MIDSFIVKCKSLASFGDSKYIYWSGIDGQWVKYRNLARKMPEDIANHLIEYFKFEGVESIDKEKF